MADQLQAKLSPREKAAIEQQPTADLAAYDCYIRAKTLLAVSSDSRQGTYLDQAARLLEQAIARDSTFLLAYCKLVYAYQELYYTGFDHSARRLQQANEAMKKALELGPDRGGSPSRRRLGVLSLLFRLQPGPFGAGDCAKRPAE